MCDRPFPPDQGCPRRVFQWPLFVESGRPLCGQVSDSDNCQEIHFSTEERLDAIDAALIGRRAFVS